MFPWAHQFLAGGVARVRDAVSAGPLRCRPGRVHQCDLAKAGQCVGGAQLVECRLRRRTLGEQLQPPEAIAAVRERLRGHDADTGSRPWHGRPCVERL